MRTTPTTVILTLSVVAGLHASLAYAQPLAPAPAPGTPSAPGAVAAPGAVVPQIVVPLGRTPVPPASAASGVDVPMRAASAPGGIDDSVAQCRAQSTRLARQECMDRVGRAHRPR